MKFNENEYNTLIYIYSYENTHTNTQQRAADTLIATSTAWPTRPGSDCHVPSPTDGNFAPVLNSKYRISSAIFQLNYFSTTPLFLEKKKSNTDTVKC